MVITDLLTMHFPPLTSCVSSPSLPECLSRFFFFFSFALQLHAGVVLIIVVSVVMVFRAHARCHS